MQEDFATSRHAPPSERDWASTHQIAGLVIFGGGSSMEGILHLQVSTATRSSAETPLEMLNRPEGFIPVTLSDEDVRLVAKDQIAAVSFGPDAPQPEHLPTTESLGLEVQMADGSEYRGEVHIELRPGNSRGLDLLNQPERFFPLSVPGRTWYLNRSQVQYVQPHD